MAPATRAPRRSRATNTTAIAAKARSVPTGSEAMAEASFGVQLVLLVLAWAASLAVRPWRLLCRYDGELAPLLTPVLASLAVLPCLWSFPGLAALPLPLHWSGAPLVMLLVGWPLAVPVITL